MSEDVFIAHETAPQAALHTCWPAATDLWADDLAPARAEFARFLTLTAAAGEDGRALPLVIYAATQEAEADARRRLGSLARVVRAPYGDVWARDTGPIFVKRARMLQAVRFTFNGWGGKYQLEGDESIGAVIAAEAGASATRSDFVCEAGALEFDGAGTVITTRQCLLNANRNPGWTERQIEAELERRLGVRTVIWLNEGLVGDHTDGHVDNLARFAAPGVVVCQTATGVDDPNARIYAETARALRTSTDAQGRRLKVIEIPSPGLVADAERAPAPASHMNWVIGPRHVVMPAYNRHARDAVRILQSCFNDRTVVASDANHILTGGGAFHCVTCHQPA